MMFLPIWNVTARVSVTPSNEKVDKHKPIETILFLVKHAFRIDPNAEKRG